MPMEDTAITRRTPAACIAATIFAPIAAKSPAKLTYTMSCPCMAFCRLAGLSASPMMTRCLPAWRGMLRVKKGEAQSGVAFGGGDDGAG